jgi:lipopolysaccharide/colanic/teichoic acid biosynthesis glycosyltransferase
MNTQIILAIYDGILINGVFLLAFLLRYGLPLPRQNFEAYKDSFLFLAFLYMLAFALARVFQPRFKTYWNLFLHTFKGMFLGTLFSFAFVYFFREKLFRFPSSILIIVFLLGTAMIFAANALLLRILGKIKKKVLVIGKPHLNVIDILDENDITQTTHIENIQDLLKHEDADEVIICQQPQDDNQMNLLIFLLLKLKVNVIFSPTLYAKLLSGSVMEENALRYIATSLGRKSDLEEFLIRALDITVSIALLISLTPLMLLISILIKITSKGPVIYKQERIAKDGKAFTLIKFRTMQENAETKSGPVWAEKNDSRVTKIGKFLRQTRLDEIPQLINVLKGEMSLVGPRPERMHFVKRHKALREMRLAVKPGLTGFAQIRNSYNLHPKHKIKYDYLYLQKRSLLLNLYIIFKTIPVIFMKKGQ